MKCKNGYTFIEVIISIWIISIISQVVIMSSTTINNKYFTKAVDTLADDLRYIQRMAIINGKDYSLEFMTGDRVIKEYRVFDGGIYIGNVLNPNFRTVTLPKDVVISNTTIENAVVSYTSRGTVSGAGTIFLYYENKTVEITITPGAGRVLVKR